MLFRPTKRQIRLNWMLKKWKTSHHVFRQKTDPTAEVSTCYWILYVEAGIYIKEIMEHGISDMYKTYLTVLLFSTSSAIKEHSSEGRVCILPLIWMQGGRDEEERIPPPPPKRENNLWPLLSSKSHLVLKFLTKLSLNLLVNLFLWGTYYFSFFYPQ